MIEIKAPDDYSAHKGKKSVFLAGSIEMGAAEDWQKKIADGLKSTDILVLNPRRAQWDATWEQSKDNPPFREQVEWELNALEAANLIIVYLAPGTKSPITLMELGIHAAANPEKVVVCCPAGFWRKGNVDIVCERYGVRQVESIDALISFIIQLDQKVA